MIEDAYLVTPGKQPAVVVKVAGAVITEAPEPISQMKFKNWDWAQGRFRAWGWAVTRIEAPAEL